MGINGKWTAFI